MARQRVLQILLCLLGLFLLGTVIVLSTVSYYLAIEDDAYLTETDLSLESATIKDANQQRRVERIPRILHQTWKTVDLPPTWKAHSLACREMMPDYKYMLWTDEGSRNFIATHYPWFLDHFDGYKYAIQRADAIRYFVLYHFGGVYMDLDIGCVRSLDPLLKHSVVLPKTIPVGVSNDLMLAEKGHPFLEQTIHNLITFDHTWCLNYPTVMFSTGPMFLSAQYGLYTSFKSNSPATRTSGIRILPKSLYGKNVSPDEAPHTFFRHYYGSSWHTEDAAFIWFLGKRGKLLMWLGLGLLLIGVARINFRTRRRRRSIRKLVGYDALLAWLYHGTLQQPQDLPWSIYFEPSSPTVTESSSESSLETSDSARSSFSLLPTTQSTRSSIQQLSPKPNTFSGSTRHVPSHEHDCRNLLDNWSLSPCINVKTSLLRPNSHRRRRPAPVVFFVPTVFGVTEGEMVNYSNSQVPPPYDIATSAHSSSADILRLEEDGLVKPLHQIKTPHRRIRAGSVPEKLSLRLP